MKCYVPFVDNMTPAGERFMRIAGVMGADCVSIPVTRSSPNPLEDLEHALDGKDACLALCPDIAQTWIKAEEIPPGLVSFITTHFQFLLIHELDSDATSNRLLRAFSNGALHKVRNVEDITAKYCVKTAEICGEFSGLEFGSPSPSDRILTGQSDSTLIEPIVTIAGAPVFAKVNVDPCEIFFLGGVASGNVEFHSDLVDENFAVYFREIVPLAMFLRHVFRDECWRPANSPSAALIVDDPPLWKRYGFLNYAKLMTMMDEFNFHTCIAFIPYYWKNTTASTVKRFKDRPDRLSVCFHGNDHTAAEFASLDSGKLDSRLATATARMKSFSQRTSIPCDRVIVFPQGKFSRAAMQALKKHNFVAAVNSHHFPREEPIPLTLADLLQPAILSFDGFPLFLRRYVREIHPEYIAWNAFFGRPILIVEHHEIFKDPTPLLELASTINKVLPNVQWRNLEAVVENACLRRVTADGAPRIRAYASAARIHNPGQSHLRCILEWPQKTEGQVSQSGGASPIIDLDTDTTGAFDIAPGSTARLTMQARTDSLPSAAVKLPLKEQVKVHLRRRLSEFRDNYMSKSPVTMSFVKLARQLLR